MHEPANDTTAWWNDLLSGARAAGPGGAPPTLRPHGNSTAWLDEHAGALRAAPKRAGNAQYAVIEPAPGRYVKTKPR